MLSIFFKTRHKPVNFAKLWRLNAAIPLYTDARRKLKKGSSQPRRTQPPHLFTPPALLSALKDKQSKVTAIHPYIATNHMPQKTLQARKP